MIVVNSRYIRLIFGVVLIGVMSGCKTMPDQFAYSSSLSDKDLIEGTEFLGRPLVDEELPVADIMDVSSEMEIFLKQYVKNVGGHARKARELSKSILNKNILGIEYNPRLTFTAAEAFEQGQGNCLSFSFLYAALARKSGLNVEFQEVHILPQWDYVNDEIYIENRHINVRVDVKGSNDLIVDIDAVSREKQQGYTILDDDHVLALYYGNIGAEYLMNGDNENSFKYFAKAIRTDSEISLNWTNLGVLYRRAGNDKYAEKAYFVALSLNEDDQAALNNLSYLYREAGDDEKADYYGEMVKKYQLRNPYFRFVKAQMAMEEENYKVALDHINYAIRKKKKEPRFYQLKSEIYAMLGEHDKAFNALRSARNIKTIIR